MKILITQPTFLPWVGFFDLIDQADIVVFLNDVQFSKRSWQQRNKIKTKNGLEWITIPAEVKGLRNQNIKDTKINLKNFDFEKFKNKIIFNYSKAKYFSIYIGDFFKIIENELSNGSISDLNLSIIKWLMKIFKIEKKIYLSSELDVDGKKTQKIINICNKLNSKSYISTIGSKEYLQEDIELIKKNKIKTYFHNYIHPKYTQCYTPFIPFASSLDILMNEGDKSLSIIKSGRLKLISF